MKKVALALLILILSSTIVLATISVNSINRYNELGASITRDYLIDGDTVVADVTTDSLKGNMALMLSPDGGGAGCVRLSKTHYVCTYTDSMYGPSGLFGFYVTGVDYLTGEQEQTDNQITLYLNPNVTLTQSDQVAFGTLKPGKTNYSNIITINTSRGNNADARIYVKGKTTYSSTPGRCPRTNTFPTSYIQYSVNGGIWKTLSTFWQIVGINSATIQFRANVPSVCIGTYDIAKGIQFYTAAI